MEDEEVEKDELTKRREEEYQMQLFGLHRRTVYAALKQKIEANVDSRCKQIYTSIEKKYKPNEKGIETLKNNIKQLRKTYRENMQPHLEALEKVVNKFIKVPDDVLLEGDEDQAIQYTDEEYHKLEIELKDIQEKVKRATIFQAELEEECETLDSLQKQIELATQLCDLVEKGLDDKNMKSKKISNKSQQAIEKYKSLTETLDCIKPETLKDIYNPKLDTADIEPVFLNE